MWSFLFALVALFVAVGESFFRHRPILFKDKPSVNEDDINIHLFLSRFRLSKKTVELYWMMGALFRLKGNIDYALRIHGAILEKGMEIERAKLEMAEDFFTAGLYDQAENLLLQVHKDPYRIKANKLLRLIYTREKEWQKAIAITELLSIETKVPWHHEIAHFYCELALRAWVVDQYAQAFFFTEKALNIDRHNVRANMIAGQIYLVQQDWLLAINRFRAIETQDPAYLSLIIESLLRAYAAWGKTEEILPVLWRYWEQHRLVEALLAWFDCQENKRTLLLLEETKKNPDLKLLLKILDFKTSQESLETSLIRDFLRDLEERAKHVCRQCGYKTSTFLWQCPSCESWSTMTPQKVVHD